MAAVGRFLLRQLRARPLAAFALGFLAGVALAGRIDLPIGKAAVLCLIVLTAALLSRKRFPKTAMLLVLALAMLLGSLRLTAAKLAIPDVETQYSVAMVGRIDSDPYTNPETGRVISRFRLESLNGEHSTLCLRLYLRGDAEPLSKIEYGQRLSLIGHIWANDPPTNPYEFDFGAYLHRNGMSAMATAKVDDVSVLGTDVDARGAFIQTRRALSARIDALFPRNAPLARALLLGDRSQLSEELRESLRATGTAHLICISGLHVTLLAAALAALLGLALPRRWARAAAVALLIPYGIMIGFTPSYLRALLMFAILSFAPVAGHPSDGLTRLCAALLVSLILRPMSLSDAGFVLSYSATAGLILLMPPLERLFGVQRLKDSIPRRAPVWAAPHKRLLLYAVQLLCASLSAHLASLPGVVAFFGVQPVLSLPFNLVCVPLCMAGYLLAAVSLVLSGLFLPLGRVVAMPGEALFTMLSCITRLSEALPLTAVRIGRYPAALVLLHGGLMVAASDLTRLKERLRAWLPLTLVAVAGLSTLLTFAASWPFHLVFLDAEQADCAVITTHGHTYLVDAGDTYTPAADYLSATCLKLDGVFISHLHQDHAGGLMDVLDAFTPGVVYLPDDWETQPITSPVVEEVMERVRDMGIPVKTLGAGDRVVLSDEATLTVYGPVQGRPAASMNDLSMLALVECGGHTALFTGDLEVTGEPRIIPAAEVLKVAHHGADNGTSPRFLNACRPEIAVISVGENRFGHPSELILNRLKRAGARTLLTRETGAITLTPGQDGWRIKTYLEAPP